MKGARRAPSLLTQLGGAESLTHTEQSSVVSTGQQGQNGPEMGSKWPQNGENAVRLKPSGGLSRGGPHAEGPASLKRRGNGQERPGKGGEKPPKWAKKRENTPKTRKNAWKAPKRRRKGPETAGKDAENAPVAGENARKAPKKGLFAGEKRVKYTQIRRIHALFRRLTYANTRKWR